MVRSNSLLLVVAGLLATAGAAAALAGDAGEYTFTVLKDGSPVGHHCIVFQRRGDRVEIREATEIEVRLAMIPIYRFEHEGTEVWQDGRALRIDGTTNDIGEKLDIAVRRNADGYTRRINGRVDKFDASKQVLAFWNKDVVNHDDFFSAVEDKVIRASFEFVAPDKITVAGQSSTSNTIAWSATRSATSGSTGRGALRRSRFRASAQRSRTCATSSFLSRGHRTAPGTCRRSLSPARRRSPVRPPGRPGWTGSEAAVICWPTRYTARGGRRHRRRAAPGPRAHSPGSARDRTSRSTRTGRSARRSDAR